MGLFSRKSEPEPQPKDEPEEVSAVQETLDRLNAYSTESMRRLKNGAKWGDPSIMMLEWKASQEQAKLLHEHGVIPVVDDTSKTGKWKLFGR